MILGRAYNTWTSCLTLGTLPGLLQNGQHRYDSGNKDWSFYFLKPNLEEWTLLSPISSISPHKEAHVSLFHPLTISLSLLVKSMYHHIFVLTKFHWNTLFGCWETIYMKTSFKRTRQASIPERSTLHQPAPMQLGSLSTRGPVAFFVEKSMSFHFYGVTSKMDFSAFDFSAVWQR